MQIYSLFLHINAIDIHFYEYLFVLGCVFALTHVDARAFAVFFPLFCVLFSALQ